MNIEKYLHNPKISWWIGITIILIAGIYFYLLYAKYHPATDNAYINADVVNISPQVSGPILHLYVRNYDAVKKNQPLFDIDPAPFVVAMNRAAAQLDLAKQKVEALRHSVQISQALVDQRQSELLLAEQNFKRIDLLVKKKQFSLAQGDKAIRDVKVARASLVEAQDQLLKVQAQLGDSNSPNAEVRAAEAELAQAKLNLDYTHVIAPVDGYIVNLTARAGSLAQSGTTYFAIVDGSHWWVDANYKETEISRIHPGQTAEITVDIYPDHTFHGAVESISRGSGAAFSIFPAENATGNWVKVTQRFSVRVKILDPDPNFPLRIGASSAIRINTRGSHQAYGNFS